MHGCVPCLQGGREGGRKGERGLFLSVARKDLRLRRETGTFDSPLFPSLPLCLPSLPPSRPPYLHSVLHQSVPLQEDHPIPLSLLLLLPVELIKRCDDRVGIRCYISPPPSFPPSFPFLSRPSHPSRPPYPSLIPFLPPFVPRPPHLDLAVVTAADQNGGLSLPQALRRRGRGGGGEGEGGESKWPAGRSV